MTGLWGFSFPPEKSQDMAAAGVFLNLLDTNRFIQRCLNAVNGSFGE
jgi:hypothetical protein